MSTAAVATLGHNNPPTPFDECERKVFDLFDEAKGFLDGEPITTQPMCDAVSKLLDMIRVAKREADEHRKTEKRPHDEAAKAVQEKWNPLLVRCDLAADAAKKALTPFLEAQEAEKRAKAEAARKEAEEKARAAQEALRASRDDLTAREQAEAMLAEAKKADAAANRAEKDKAQGKGGARAVSLRTSYVAEIQDYQALARHIWEADKQALNTFLDEYAAQKVRAGARSLPGVHVREVKGAV
jgi:DNA-directed RNA polymerase beta subunit